MAPDLRSGYLLIYNFSTIPSHATSACSSEKRSLSSSRRRRFPPKLCQFGLSAPLARRHFMIDEPLFGERGDGQCAHCSIAASCVFCCPFLRQSLKGCAVTFKLGKIGRCREIESPDMHPPNGAPALQACLSVLCTHC